jgi:hypothetical protein
LGEREKKSPGGNIFRSGAHRTKNNGSFGKISILMAMFASVDYANQFGRAVRRQVPELKKATVERGWGARLLARRHKHLPFYQRR